jgi:peptide/nickel transport system substrate-binding protein
MTVTYTYQYGDPALGVERLYVTRNMVKGTPFANVQGYSNPKADDLWAKGGNTMDPVERQKLYSELQQILVTRWPMPTCSRSSSRRCIARTSRTS